MVITVTKTYLVAALSLASISFMIIPAAGNKKSANQHEQSTDPVVK